MTKERPLGSHELKRTSNTPDVYTNSACFSSIVCPIAGLQLSTGKLRIVDKRVFFNASRRGLKESLNKLLTVRFCWKLTLVKSSAQTRECLEGVKHSLFIYKADSLFSFGSWINFKVLTVAFEWFSSKIPCSLETKTCTVSNFPHFLTSPK